MTKLDPALDPETTKRTLRRLHGESQTGESADGSRVESEEPEVQRVERLWRALEIPPATEPPPDFASRTADALRRRRAAGSWAVAPAWARGSAAAALAAGLLLGLGVGRLSPAETATATATTTGIEQVELVEGLGPESADWTDEGWSEAWDRAFDASFGSSGDGS